MTENIFRNSRGTFTCDDCGQAATVPSLIKHSEDCEGAQMTEPESRSVQRRKAAQQGKPAPEFGETAYTKEDLRRTREVAAKHNITLDDLDEQHIAAEFAKLRREVIKDPSGQLLGQPLAEVQAALIYYDKRRERDQRVENLVRALSFCASSRLDKPHVYKAAMVLANAALAEWERSAHEGE